MSSSKRPDELARKLDQLLRERRADRDGELDRLLRPRLRAYFQSHGVFSGDVDDLVQNCLVRVFRGVDELRDTSRFLPWLFTIARNVRFTAAVRGRWEGGRAELPEPLPADAPGPEREAVARERLTLVQTAIEALPAQQRQCLLLQVREGLSHEKIGSTLALSPFTVRNHIALARRALRLALHEEEDA